MEKQQAIELFEKAQNRQVTGIRLERQDKPLNHVNPNTEHTGDWYNLDMIGTHDNGDFHHLQLSITLENGKFVAYRHTSYFDRNQYKAPDNERVEYGNSFDLHDDTVRFLESHLTTKGMNQIADYDIKLPELSVKPAIDLTSLSQESGDLSIEFQPSLTPLPFVPRDENWKSGPAWLNLQASTILSDYDSVMYSLTKSGDKYQLYERIFDYKPEPKNDITLHQFDTIDDVYQHVQTTLENHIDPSRLSNFVRNNDELTLNDVDELVDLSAAKSFTLN